MRFEASNHKEDTSSTKSTKDDQENALKARAELSGAFSSLRVGTNLSPQLLSEQDELDLDDQFDKSKQFRQAAGSQWRRRSLYACVTVGLGLLISSIFLWLGITGAQRQQTQEFHQRASELIQALMETLHDYETSALWIHEACRATKDHSLHSLERGICTWEDFLDVHQHIRSTGLQFNSMRFIPNVTHAERPALEEFTREYLQEHYPMINYVGFSEPPGAQFTAAEDVNETLIQALEDEEDNYLMDTPYNWTDNAPNTTLPTSNSNTSLSSTGNTILTPGQGNATHAPGPNDGTEKLDFSIYKPRRPAAWYLPVHRFAPMPAPIIDVDIASGELLDYISVALDSQEAKLWPRKKFLPILQEDGFLLVHPGVGSSERKRNKGVAIILFYTSQILAGALRYREPDGKTVYLYDVSDKYVKGPLYYGGAYACGHSEEEDEGAMGNQQDSDRHHHRVCPVQEEVAYSDLESNYHGVRGGSRSGHRRDWMLYRDIVVLDKTLRLVVTAPADKGLSSQEILVILGGVLIFVACVVLAISFYRHMGRVSKLHEEQAAAATERANLIIGNAKRAMMAERELNDFIAHEVRNPISAAISANTFIMAELDQEDDPSLQQMDPTKLATLREDAHIVGSSLQYVTDLLRNMLDMHRSTSGGGIQINKTPVDVLNDIFQPVATLVGARGVGQPPCTIQVDCTPQLIIKADRMRLKQVILNLAGNSRKFLPASGGFIRLTARECADESVALCVEDSGLGIPIAKRDMLFDKFQESLDSLNQGTGVGLALCRNLVTLMDGTIYLDETYGSGVPGCPGARFVVQLKNVKLSPEEMDALGIPQEDYLVPISSFSASPSASMSLPPQPLAVSLVGARTKVDSSCTTASVTSDGLTGEEKNLGDDSYAGNMVSMSASPPPPPKTATSEAPTKALSLQNDNALAGKPEEGEEDVDALPSSLKVLFVDDDTMLRKLFTRAVRKAVPGWDVQEASNGETALRMVDTQEFDLIFMDQYMASVEKQMLGTETVRALRAKGVTSIICGLSANDSKDLFLEAGANTFTLKPFPCKKDELTKKLKEVVGSNSIDISDR